MSGKFPVRHVRGFSLKWNQVRRGLDRGTLAWTDESHSEVRDTTLVEAREIQSRRAQARALEAEVVTGPEVGGCRFIPPPTTTYRAPWAEIEAMCAPMMVRKCHWPKAVTA